MIEHLIPLKCYACEESIDLPVDLYERETTVCPMCGETLDGHRAEVFELPCPEEVEIEDETPESLVINLRLTTPRMRQEFWIMSKIVLSLVVVTSILVLRSWGRSAFLIVPIFAAAFLGVWLVALLQLKNRNSIELTPTSLTLSYYRGPFCFQRKVKMVSIKKFVWAKQSDWLFRFPLYHAILIKADFFNSQLRLPNQFNSEQQSRYITHILRRRLRYLTKADAAATGPPVESPIA